MNKTKSKTYLLGAIYVILSSILFSSKAIFIKKAFGESNITPISLMMMRMICSVPLLWGIVGWEILRCPKQKMPLKLGPKEWFDVSIVGITGYYLASWFDFKGLMTLSVGLERILLYLYPTFVVILGAVFLKTRISQRIIFPLILCYIGVFMAFSGEITERGFQNISGMLYVVLSALLFAIFVMTSGRLIKKIGGTRFSAYAMTVSTISIIVHYSFTQPVLTILLYPELIPLVMAIALFSTVIPVNLMAAGLNRVGTNHYAILSCVGPMSTMVMGWMFLQENPSSMEWCGLVIVVFAGALLGYFKNTGEGIKTSG